MKKILAIFIAKQTAFWSQVFGKGGGAALPGLLAMRIYPEIVKELTENLEKGVILVTGTNGKTTTSKMITEILKANGERVLSNSGGSNLMRGIASALVDKSTIFGHIREERGVYEVDEATMPKLIKSLKAKIKNSEDSSVSSKTTNKNRNKNSIEAIVITNIFRDQLDRYGEVDKTAEILKNAVKSSPGSTLVLNADDPIVSYLGRDQKEVIYFGINDKKITAQSKLAIDIRDCLVCDHELEYTARYYGHIGLYSCTNCGFSRPKTKITAKNINLGLENISSEINTGKVSNSLTLPMIGLYNLYNALAAISAGNFIKVKNTTIFKALKRLTPVFGRMESFEINGKKGAIYLVKNPIGFNQVVEAISKNRGGKVALLALNDNFADGTDISWIWDSEFEVFSSGFKKIVISGIRSEDLRLRLKYANVTSRIIITKKNLEEAFETAISETKNNESLYILPTYTAMLSLRNILVKKNVLKDYWK